MKQFITLLVFIALPVSIIADDSIELAGQEISAPVEEIEAGLELSENNEFPEYEHDRSLFAASCQDYWRDYKEKLDERMIDGEIDFSGYVVRHMWSSANDFLLAPFVSFEKSAGQLGYDIGREADAWTITKDATYMAGNGLLAGASLYPGGKVLSGGRLFPQASSKTSQMVSSSRFLEYQAMRKQGYTASEAHKLMKLFDKGVNPGKNWAFHFTNEKAASGIVRSGEIWASKGGLRGTGTYAGRIPNPSETTKTALWYINPGSKVRIPVDCTKQSGVVQDVIFPLKSTIFRDGVKLTQ